MHLKMCLCIAALFFIMQAAMAEENESTIKITPSGFAYYQIGQIESYTPNDGSLMDKMFDQHFNGRLTLSAVINQKLQIIVGGEAELGSTGTHDLAQKITPFILKEAQGIYSFGDPENSPLQIAAGYFPFKYNPESSNLGEYLFRSGAYPGYVITDFDFAKARLMGFNVSSTLFENLHLNMLFTSEYREPPFFDYSLSFLAGYKLPNKILDFGAGIDFNRLIPIDPSKTTDHSNVIVVNGKDVIENGDTLFYTKIGTKIMGRLTFDPKPFLPFADLLNPSDLKLYGEFAILGLKKYGTYYSDIYQRIPVMVGFNVPCFKTIDLVSLELEYYGQNPAYIANMPSAASKATPDDYSGQSRSYFKWSIYGMKTITKGLAVKGLIGRDHFRGTDPVGNYDPADRMNGPDDWHYNLRIMYSF